MGLGDHQELLLLHRVLDPSQLMHERLRIPLMRRMVRLAEA